MSLSDIQMTVEEEKKERKGEKSSYAYICFNEENK